MSTPAKILRAFLVRRGVVCVPFVRGKIVPQEQHSGDQVVPCYVSASPNDPDNVVTVFDAQGLWFGRRQADGKNLIHNGLFLIVRHRDYGKGYNLAVNLAIEVEKLNSSESPIVVDDKEYWVDNVYRTSTVVPLGEDVGTKLLNFSFNARMSLQDRQSILG